MSKWLTIAGVTTLANDLINPLFVATIQANNKTHSTVRYARKTR